MTGRAAMLPVLDKNAIVVTLDETTKTLRENLVVAVLAADMLATASKVSFGWHAYSQHLRRRTRHAVTAPVCSDFVEAPSAGQAVFALSPRSFKDVNGVIAVPDRGFKLTCEVCAAGGFGAYLVRGFSG